jgi:hypothetical protein
MTIARILNSCGAIAGNAYENALFGVERLTRPARREREKRTSAGAVTRKQQGRMAAIQIFELSSRISRFKMRSLSE